MSAYYDYLWLGAMALLAVGMLFGLIRAMRGPRVADRIMGINMIGTLSVLALAVLAFYLGQGWLLDVCIIYAMISFLAVVVLSHIHITASWNGEDDDNE